MSGHTSVHELNTEIIGHPKIPEFPIRAVLSEYNCAATVKSTYAAVTEKPAEPSRSHLVQILDVDVPLKDPENGRLMNNIRLFACSCESYQFHTLSRDTLRAIDDDPASALGSLETCKHGEAVRKDSKYGKERPEGQSGFESYPTNGGNGSSE